MLAAVFILGLGASSCGRPTSIDQPEIRVDPGGTLFFPRVVASTTRTAPLTVRNVGRALLRLDALEIQGGQESPYHLAGDRILPIEIEPGESIVLEVVYEPQVGGGSQADADTLTITSNDPEPGRSNWAVGLRSANKGPSISIVPAEVDFSLVEGHRGPVTLTVTNSGTEPTEVADVYIEGGPEFLLSGPGDGSLPRPLAVGETFTVEVSCHTLEASDLEETSGVATVIARPTDSDHPSGSATLYGPPTAFAGYEVDTSPLPKQASYLNGRGSRSLGNAISGYRWTVVGWPTGSLTAESFNRGEPQMPDYVDAPTCPPGQNVSPEPCFIPDVPGLYRLELEVIDQRPVCALKDPSEPCTSSSQCCSFQCEGTCQGQAGDGVCREGGGCVIESINFSSVEVRAMGTGVLVFLSWDGTGDFDLHLVDDFAGRCEAGGESCRLEEHCQPGDTCQTAMRRQWRGAGDCYWQNPQPDWGAPRTHNGVACSTSFDCLDYRQYPDCVGPTGDSYCTNTLDDPRLAKDESTAFGPEIIRLRDPIHAPGPPNVYHVGVHYFPDPQAYQARTATLQVFYEGVEVFAASQPGLALSRRMENRPGEVNAFWYVGWIEVAPGDATLIPSGMDLFNLETSGFPPLQDPP